MDAKEIRELIELISKSDFSTFEMEREGFRLRLVRRPAESAVPRPAAARAIAASPAEPAPGPPAATASTPSVAPAAPASEDGTIEMTSPIVGTFYNAPSPGADPFVSQGEKVSKGDTLCIIEAMKLMNEIEAEIDAEVLEVVVANGQPVEYGEVLFRLRPLH